MIKITLPNGAIKEFQSEQVTGRQVAEAIGPRLAKDAIGVVVDGTLQDLSCPIKKDATIAIVTPSITLVGGIIASAPSRTALSNDA